METKKDFVPESKHHHLIIIQEGKKLA